MPYANPPEQHVQRLDSSQHITAMIVDWWKANIGNIMSGNTTEIERVIQSYAKAAVEVDNDEFWEDLNTFMEISPINLLDLTTNQVLYNNLKQFKNNLKSFEAFYSALKVVMISRRSLDAEIFDVMFPRN